MCVFNSLNYFTSDTMCLLFKSNLNVAHKTDEYKLKVENVEMSEIYKLSRENCDNIHISKPYRYFKTPISTQTFRQA